MAKFKMKEWKVLAEGQAVGREMKDSTRATAQ